MRFIPPAYPFRAGFGYTNMAFLAAGQLIPAITGMEWQDFLRQRLFEPTGMRSTITNGSILDKYSNKAAPHEIIDGKVCPVPYGSLDPIAPAGAIIASIHDLSKWLRLQLGNGLLDGVQIITSSVIERTRTPHTLIPILPSQRLLSPTTHFSAYGLGWFLRDYQGKLLVSHGGGVDGMLSYIAMLPEDNLGIAVLTNKLPNGLYQGLAMQVIDAFLGMPEINWSARMQEMTRQMDADQAAAQQQLENSRAKDTRPSLPPDAFAGEYHNPLYGTIILKTAGSELVAELSAHPHLRGVLEHWHYDTFLCRWNDPILRTSLMPFQTNGQGKVQSFQTKFREDWIDTVDYEFRKTD
jgi:CubicO group peptidase (beta-lactamase class C family)